MMTKCLKLPKVTVIAISDQNKWAISLSYQPLNSKFLSGKIDQYFVIVVHLLGYVPDYTG